jgi:hypothetical protein
MKENHQNPSDAYDAPESALTPALALEKLGQELALAKQLEKEAEWQLAKALASRLALNSALNSETLKDLESAKALASDWAKEMEMVLAKAKKMVRAKGSQNC